MWAREEWQIEPWEIRKSNMADGHYRAGFFSDMHLGTRGANSDAFLEFFRRYEFDHLYFVGDTIDGWSLKRSFYWSQSHSDVVQKILRRARKGIPVKVIRGNHDDFLAEYYGMWGDSLEVCGDAVHVTATGRRLSVIHGDQWDPVVDWAPWMAKLGDIGYHILLRLNRISNGIQLMMRRQPRSLSAYIKKKVKAAVATVSNYEEAVTSWLQVKKLDGVVCGHIHVPAIKQIGNFLYLNCGDWVESSTAIVEEMDGSLVLLQLDEEVVVELGRVAPDGRVLTAFGSTLDKHGKAVEA
jgi:UDP-2,3-diacylglucosamine pyrophosphatase LpxH